MRNKIQIIFLALTTMFITSCATLDNTIGGKSKLSVDTKMSNTIFLDPVAEEKRTVYVHIRNTSSKRLNIDEDIKSALRGKGYRVMANPDKAHYMIQANILHVSQVAEDKDPFGALAKGYGSAVLGGVAGHAITGGHRDGATGGALLIAGADYIVSRLNKVVKYSMITDLQVSERVYGGELTRIENNATVSGNSSVSATIGATKAKWRKYQTRIISVAEKSALKFEEATPHLEEGLIMAISGLL